ncbi:myb-like protein x [Anaeramoeba flamelloides]|uniref:Myb-like protein x n=1 Tax=Anaeramoeba flamelloides TaxID=1746091 RepID=A0ABQ8XDZ8_9EUKA|nr:myb-like protein x [Anaeramoeba flamelloides]
MFNKKKIQAQVELGIICISNLKKKNRTIFLRWKHGRENGETKKLILDKYGSAEWNEEFRFSTVFVKDLKTNKYLKKKQLAITVFFDEAKQKSLRIRSKKTEIKLLAKLNLDLSSYLNQDLNPFLNNFNLLLNEKQKNKTIPTLLLCLRINLQPKNQRQFTKNSKIQSIFKDTSILRKLEEFETIQRTTQITISSEDDFSENRSRSTGYLSEEINTSFHNKKKVEINSKNNACKVPTNLIQSESKEKEKEKVTKKKNHQNSNSFEMKEKRETDRKRFHKKQKLEEKERKHSLNDFVDLDMSDDEKRFTESSEAFSSEFSDFGENEKGTGKGNTNDNKKEKALAESSEVFSSELSGLGENENENEKGKGKGKRNPNEKVNENANGHNSKKKSHKENKGKNKKYQDAKLRKTTSFVVDQLFGNEQKKKIKKKSKEEMIEEQKDILKTQDKEINELTKIVKFTKLLELEKWLIERILFFSESIYSNGFPLPSCLIFKSFLHWDAFNQTPTQRHRNKKREDLLTCYTNSLNLLIKVKNNEIETLFWLVSNIIFFIRLINYHFDNFKKKNKKEKNELKIKKEMKKVKRIKNFKAQLKNILQENLRIIYQKFLEKLNPYVIIYFLEKNEKSLDQQINNTNSDNNNDTTDDIGVMDTKIDDNTDIINVEFPFNSIKNIFQKLLNYSKANYLPNEIINMLLMQLVKTIDIILAQELLNNKKHCTCGNALRIKMLISLFEEWFIELGLKENQFKFVLITQSSQILAKNKLIIANGDENYKLCKQIAPDLDFAYQLKLIQNIQQDEFDTNPISQLELKYFKKFIKLQIGGNKIKKNEESNIKNKKNDDDDEFEKTKIPIDYNYLDVSNISFNQINCINWDLVQPPYIIKQKKEFKFLLERIKKN